MRDGAGGEATGDGAGGGDGDGDATGGGGGATTHAPSCRMVPLRSDGAYEACSVYENAAAGFGFGPPGGKAPREASPARTNQSVDERVPWTMPTRVSTATAVGTI